jgi:hypothetical protein
MAVRPGGSWAKVSGIPNRDKKGASAATKIPARISRFAALYLAGSCRISAQEPAIELADADEAKATEIINFVFAIYSS